MIIALIVALFASLTTAAYFMLSRRRKLVHLKLEDNHELPTLADAMAMVSGLTGGSLHHGNSLCVYQNGALLDGLFAAVDEAEHSVHFETFAWSQGELERRFVDLLCRKARDGVIVRVLVDFIGATRADDAQFDKLRGSGVEFVYYKPVHRMKVRRFNTRLHRKSLIVDGRIGFVFGHGIADEWMGDAEDSVHWRDTGVKFEGSAVAGLQSVFVRDWISASHRVPLDECFPPLPEESPGNVVMQLVSSGGGDQYSAVALLYMLAIASAREEIIIQNPYFTPDPLVPKLLIKMARRGIAVHLMIPGQYTDSPFVRRAGQRLYRQLLEAGVRIHEFTPTLSHQKIVIVDRLWSHVGSTNFDARSLALNEEISVGILDRDIAAELRLAFENDLRRCRELTLERWQRRPWYQHALDWSAYQLHSQI